MMLPILGLVGGDGWDMMDINADSVEEINAFIEKCKNEFWHTWINGFLGDTPGAVLYRPHGVGCDWDDETEGG